MTGTLPFVDRYGTAFGRSRAMLLRMSGLTGGEVCAEGAWITDDTGRHWLDLGSFGVHLLGHRHPDLVAVARDQLDRMGLSGKLLGSRAATACAEALVAATPDGLDRVAFANSGAEAVEMALKMALLATGRTELLALRGSYHGKTAGALHLSDTLVGRSPVPLSLPVRFVQPGDVDELRAALAGGRVAAAFAEPVQGEGGVRPVDPAFLAALREQTRATGTLLVLDEIQTGLGRCGQHWRSATQVEPDLLLTGKVLGGGLMPLAAVVFSSARIGEPSTDPVVLASSFAGGALAGAVGAAVVRLTGDPAFLATVRRLGATARTGLQQRLAGDPRIAGITGEGLMLGLRAATPAVAGNVVLEAARRGVLLSFCLSNPSVVRIYPPAVIGDHELADAMDRIADAVAACPPVPSSC
jgi:acetylornithine/succinyldiaminopimelate/putrescine aminotransferase